VSGDLTKEEIIEKMVDISSQNIGMMNAFILRHQAERQTYVSKGVSGEEYDKAGFIYQAGFAAGNDLWMKLLKEFQAKPLCPESQKK
jgi:hypothetical protein